MDTPGSLGEWLKKRRKVLDLTQEELAERAGCSIFALRKIEAGDRKPSKQLAGLLAIALEIPEQEQPLFIRVARGELNFERLRVSKPEIKNVSVSELLTSQNIQEPGSSSAGFGTTAQSLPVPLTPLLGRDSELAALERIFKDPQCRLLTLTGMGGIGKTRLAIEFASCHQNLFDDGVYYVSLASINEIELVAPAIAEVVGYAFSGSMELKEQLIRYMAVRMRRSALLVLDNLEHLIAQSSETVALISELLQRLPQVKILTTSRERLNLHGEWMYELHGLPVPPVELASHLDEYSAAVLFKQSAQRINMDFEIGTTESKDVIRICRLVEGTPLAIELAAAWAGMLSCREIAHEIEANIDFLSTSMYDVPERHRSLRATFDHSWTLLSNPERDVLASLSVFRGGFDRGAAEKVAGATLPLLASLVSKSLLRRTETGRYDLHEVIRQYASSHLDEEKQRDLETRDRHSEYYLDLACAYEKKLKSASQQPAMREMAVEFDNMRRAWDWGIQREKFLPLGRAVRSFGWYFEVAGLIRDGIEQLALLVQALTGRHRSPRMDRTLGTTLVQQGLLYFRSGQFARARELYGEAIAILRSVSEKALLADALIFSGTIRHLNGDYLLARELIEEGLAYARETNDPWFAAYGVYNLGHIDSLMGEYQKGYEQMQEGMKLWRELGDPHSISLGLNFLVETQVKLGRCEEAIASMRESIALCEYTKNRWGMGTAYRYLGLATLAAGQYNEALSHFQKSLEIFGEYFEGWDIARTKIYIGETHLLAGELAKARSFLVNALGLARDIHSTPLMLDAITSLACMEIHSYPARAAAWLKLVASHAATTQETRERACQMLLTLEPRPPVEEIEVFDPLADQSLDAVAGLLLSD